MQIFQVYFICFVFQSALAQNVFKQNIVFNPVFNKQNFHLNDSVYQMSDGNSIQFETLKFYISNLELFQNDMSVWKENNSYHLLDASDKNSLQWQIDIPQQLAYNVLNFKLGIDSITNVTGAMGGQLDPSKGMYWTWQSGYINLKLEGTCSKCKSRKNEFQWHLGGYAFPFASVQSIRLQVDAEKPIRIKMDIAQLLNSEYLISHPNIMSPGTAAQFLSQHAATIFSIIP